MITFFDLVQKDDFRQFVSQRIGNSIGKQYSFPGVFPKLYKYSSLSQYIVDDIINERTTITSIGEFNDIFDGTIHRYGTEKEIDEAAEKEWQKYETLRSRLNLPEDILKKEYYVNLQKERFKTDSRLKFREMEFLGTYVGCFSETYTSTLMWAHYGDRNSGICIEYDFNKIPLDIVKRSIFPVAYTKSPIDVSDLINDKEGKIYQYPYDAALLCTGLNKASIWKYEKEWRLLFIYANYQMREDYKRLSPKWEIKPSKVFLGYHFMKPFFYYDFKDKNENDNCTKAIERVINLLLFLQKNNIPIAIMLPAIGEYQYKVCDITAEDLYSFLFKEFKKDNRPKSVRYYHAVHDNLMDLLEKHTGE